MSAKQLEEAEENTAKFHINPELLDTAIYESDDRIPRTQVGTILLFPEIDVSDIALMESFIKDCFSKAESELSKTYDEPTDPTMFWESGSNGKHFTGRGLNHSTFETFGINSPSIYIAGCKDMTAEYLIENAIDLMYVESRKHDKKASSEEERIGFDRYKSFLIHHVGSRKFYEFATHDGDVYHKNINNIGKIEPTVYEVLA